MTTIQAAAAAVALVALALIGSAVFVSSQSADTVEIVAAAQPGCDPSEHFAATEALFREFVDAMDRASTGSNLGDALKDMQSVRRRYIALPYPECAATFRRHMDAGMGRIVDGVLAHMGDRDIAIEPYMAKAMSEWTYAKRAKDEALMAAH